MIDDSQFLSLILLNLLVLFSVEVSALGMIVRRTINCRHSTENIIFLFIFYWKYGLNPDLMSSKLIKGKNSVTQKKIAVNNKNSILQSTMLNYLAFECYTDT